MHAAVAIGGDRQFVAVSRLQLRQSAVLEQQLRQRVILCQFFKHLFVGRRCAARRLFHHRQRQLAEQNLSDLLRTTEVKRLAGQFMRHCFQFRNARTQLAALRIQLRAIDQHAGALHFVEHLLRRQLDLFVNEAQLFVGLDARP